MKDRKQMRDTTKKIDCHLTSEIVCPYCGFEFSDSWNGWPRNDDSMEIECDDCEKEFKVYRNIEITYTSYTKKELNDTRTKR